MSDSLKINISEKILSDFDKNHFSPKYEGVFFTLEEGEQTQFPTLDDGRSLEELFPFWDMNDAHLYYRILGYLSTLFNDKVLVDIGTRRGYSACSLAFNESNTVYTYNNTEEVIENDAFSKFNNIKPFVLHPVDGDDTPLGNILSREEHANIVLSSDLIFMDTDPHSGAHEEQLLCFLIENKYKGITLWDDINVQLNNWWNETVLNYMEDPTWRALWDATCYNLKEYSWSNGGTGVICFGEQEIVLE